MQKSSAPQWNQTSEVTHRGKTTGESTYRLHLEAHGPKKKGRDGHYQPQSPSVPLVAPLSVGDIGIVFHRGNLS